MDQFFTIKKKVYIFVYKKDINNLLGNIIPLKSFYPIMLF